MKNECTICSKTFESKRKDALYCSDACKQKAHAERLAEKSKQTGIENDVEVFMSDDYQDFFEYFIDINLNEKSERPDIDAISFFYLLRNIETKDKGKKHDILLSFFDNKLKLREHLFVEDKTYKEFKAKYLSGRIIIK